MNKYGDEKKQHEEEAAHDEWICPVCSGNVEPMGKLGNREHGRCRNCGTVVNRKVV